MILWRRTRAVLQLRVHALPYAGNARGEAADTGRILGSLDSKKN